MPGFELDSRAHLPLWPAHRDVGIGVVGAGFIVRDCHLVAYAQAGFPVVGITSRTHDRAPRSPMHGGFHAFFRRSRRCSRNRRSRSSTSRSLPRSSQR